MQNDIGQAFLTQLLTTAAGRQHMLSISVDAEEGDEAGIFDQLAGFVDEPRLRRLVESHRDDEARHAQLFRACLGRLGFEKQPIPDSLKIIRQIAASTAAHADAEDAAAGRREAAVRSADDVVRTYALLLAIEERGVEQFPRIAEAFRPFDGETAELYLRVAREEGGHVRYCETIGRHYAEGEAAWQHALADARAVEAAAFFEVGRANLLYCAERGWVGLEELLALATGPGQPFAAQTP